MIHTLKGIITEKKPTESIIEVNSVGFLVFHSVNTYEKLPQIGEVAKLTTILIPREDSLNLFGFYDSNERELFKLLLTVNGIGPKSAISILSSIQSDDLVEIIQQNNLRLLKKIPGIGPKTAERIILELKDKIKSKTNFDLSEASTQNSLRDESIEALIVLGYTRQVSEKMVAEILKSNTNIKTTEEIIKLALQKFMK